MEMASRTCRLCQSLVTANHSVALFTHSSIQCKLATRFADLLNVAVDANDGLPQCVCRRCKRRLETLESALEDLEAFRKEAKDSHAAFTDDRGAQVNTQQYDQTPLPLVL